MRPHLFRRTTESAGGGLPREEPTWVYRDPPALPSLDDSLTYSSSSEPEPRAGRRPSDIYQSPVVLSYVLRPTVRYNRTHHIHTIHTIHTIYRYTQTHTTGRRRSSQRGQFLYTHHTPHSRPNTTFATSSMRTDAPLRV